MAGLQNFPRTLWFRELTEMGNKTPTRIFCEKDNNIGTPIIQN